MTITAQITPREFERIDGTMQALLRMGPFESCADPREYIRTANRLFDYCADALGYEFANSFPDTLELAASVVTGALLGSIFVADEEAA